MKECVSQYNNSANTRNIQFRGRKCRNMKGCLWRYVQNCISHSVSIILCFQLKVLCNFVPRSKICCHQTCTTLFCKPDLTDNHTPPLSTSCPYRVLLLQTVFVLHSATWSQIQMKKRQRSNALQSGHFSLLLFL